MSAPPIAAAWNAALLGDPVAIIRRDRDIGLPGFIRKVSWLSVDGLRRQHVATNSSVALDIARGRYLGL